jgi:hypothetical protein
VSFGQDIIRELNGDLRSGLRDQATNMDGASWIGIPLDTMSTRELIGVIAMMKRNSDANDKRHRERLEFRRSLRR